MPPHFRVNLTKHSSDPKKLWDERGEKVVSGIGERGGMVLSRSQSCTESRSRSIFFIIKRYPEQLARRNFFNLRHVVCKIIVSRTRTELEQIKPVRFKISLFNLNKSLRPLGKEGPFSRESNVA